MKIVKLVCTLLILSFATTSVVAQDIPLAALKQGIMSEFKTFPVQLDEETRMDKVEVGYNEVVYYYTLVNYTYDQVNFPILSQALRPNILSIYCTGEAMEGFRNSNIHMLYLYYDKNGELMGTIKTNTSHCEK
jgi:hypothetical protein